MQPNYSYHLGYDGKRLFTNFTGLGNYSRTLLSNLATYYPDNSYFLYTPRIVEKDDVFFFQNSPLFNVQLPPRGNIMPKSLWRSYGVLKQAQKHRLHLYHGLSSELPWRIHHTQIPAVVTVHDILFKQYPEQYPWLDRQGYDLKTAYACKNANLILASSNSTKQALMEYYHVPERKIQVLHLSVDDRFTQERSEKTLHHINKKYNLPKEYFLNVGSVIERKNLLNLVKALALLPPDSRLPLVVVGHGNGSYKQKVTDFLTKQNMLNEVLFVQVLSDDLPAVYQQATAFIYPSIAEGFGLPVLEGLFSGTPVITSNQSSLVEAGGSGALLVDPMSPEAIAQAMQEVASDTVLQEKLIENGYAHAQAFRGEPLTLQLMQLYQNVIGD